MSVFLFFSGFVSLVRRGLAASPPIYIAPFSPKNFLSCQTRSERGTLNGLPDGGPAEPLPRSSLWSACPPSRARGWARRLVGVRGRSPRPWSSPGRPLPRPRARTRPRARSLLLNYLTLHPSERARTHTRTRGRTCARGLKPGIFLFPSTSIPSTSKCRAVWSRVPPRRA